MTDDTQLVAQVREQPDAQARAAVLGLDWDALRAARSRLLLGAWLISIGLALLAVAQPISALVESQLTTQTDWYARDFVILVIAGGVGAYCVRQLSMYVARRMAQSPLRNPDLRREVTVGTISQAVLFPLLTLAICFLGENDGAWLLGVGVAAPIVTILELRPLTHFPIFLAQNSAVAVPVYTRMRASSPLESLLGLRIRWVLVRHLGVSLFALGTSYLAAADGWLVVPVLVVGLILDFAGARLSLAGRPIGSSLVQLALGVVVSATAAILFVAPLLAHAATGAAGGTA
jgi:hypothetical protein